MALPTSDDLITMDVASHGLPYVDSTGDTTTNLNTLDVASRGLPFLGNLASSEVSGNLHIFSDEGLIF